MRSISTGLHIVPKRLASGETRWHVYAWRNGPPIYTQDGKKPAITPELLALAYAEKRQRGPSDRFDNVIDAYRASPEFAAKADTTKREYRLRLDQISDRFGKVPIRFFNGHEIRREIVAWRNEMADTPRAADRCVGMLSTVLNWAMDNADIFENRAAGIGHLHQTNRADKVWEERHWQAVAKAPPHIHRVLALGSLTGLRLGDLLALTWEMVGRDYIALTTAKTGGEAVIPLYPELRKALGKRGKGVILRNLAGEPWTTDGFQSSWRNHRPAGFDRHFHDLRGTFITRLAVAGFNDGEIANVIGWTAKRVAAIRAKYVDRVRVAKERAARLRKPVNRKKKMVPVEGLEPPT
ncbi:tyrosine-type recombinase/integrase [Alteraurantiacibacter buctensis]|uniref:Tyrosine-type recombinase/integrase n=1 Tax=Alteraurantiacibacter buctensis TaxID=1503981 RepID=A0A844Z1N4_9SPHN|nr:tyrosine-type recombinase/integrase [Alteraurantiacibacter buctensis]MXO72901.1 tyrosine-type recombinase/integrase [Alteraurantiacibacter buctensis]